MIRRVAWAAILVLTFGLGQGAAQPIIPDGVFIRDSAGNIWLVSGGVRAAVPIYPANDSQIAAVPDSGAWIVPGPDGSLTFGARPDWAAAPAGQPMPPAAAPPALTATPIPSDALPTASIQIDDEVIDPGQTINVTVIGFDDKGLEWIEWEGTVIDDDDGEENDNRRTGDTALDGRHRHDCDGQTQCASIWQVTPTKSGRFTLRARARDNAGQTGEWTDLTLRVREGPTPTRTATPTR